MPRLSGGASQVSGSSLLGVDDGTHRHRLNSRCLRELTRGKFVIKAKEITQLENIGQGNNYTCVRLLGEMVWCT